MSSMLNKVKDAIGGHNEDTEDRRSGKLDMSDREREREREREHGHGQHGSSTFGTGDKSRSGNQSAATGDQGRFMGAGEMNPSTSSSDRQRSSNLPGSFPGASEHENMPSRHKDGREYVPPTGTQVGQGSSAGYERSMEDVPGRNNPGSYGQGTSDPSAYDRAGQAGRDTTGSYGQTSSNRGNIDERGLMDPASHDSKSNVMGGGAGAGAGAFESGSGHNKLHKRDDPRGYTGSDDPSSHHSSKHHGTHGTHDKHGTHQETIGGEPYERQSGHGHSPTDKHHGHRGAEAAAVTAGGTGVGGLASSQIPERRQHGYSGREAYPSNEQHGNTTGAGSHLASSAQGQGYDDNSRSGGVYNGVTGHGSSREPEREGTSALGRSTGQTYDSTPGVTSGSRASPREAGDSRAGAGTGALGAGAAGLASHHHNKEREREHEYGRSNEGGYGTSSGQRDPTSAGYGTSRQHDPASSYGSSGQPYSSSSQPGGMSGGMPGSASGAGGQQQQQQQQQQHYIGPGHEGAKVVHSCNHCGKDNDISHYFKKDVVYRLGQ